MSYILDALNKADQARKEGEQAIPSPQQQVSNVATSSNFGRGFLLVVVIASITMFFWLSPRQPESQPDPNSATSIDKQAPIPQVQTQQPRQIVQNKPEPLFNTEAELPAEEALEPEGIPNIMALPQSVLNALPAIKISAHTYSESAGKRMVIINGKMLHENKYISEHLLLKTITQDGIELEIDGMLFSMEALTSWPD